MNILEEIILHKQKELEGLKHESPTQSLERTPGFKRNTVSLCRALKGKGSSGVIAEIKRKSPSKGIIHKDILVNKIASGYERAGVSGLSVLTDSHFFGGSNADLESARSSVSCPILRKDFIIDEYQIMEAKSIGADVILLIAAVLAPRNIRQFCAVAHGLGMEVLLEVHNEVELKANLDAGADMMGVNNRDLKTFVVSLETSQRLSGMIPDTMVKVSESGISSPETILELRKSGYSGFLIGQSFMEQESPEKAAGEFMDRLTAMRYG